MRRDYRSAAFANGAVAQPAIKYSGKPRIMPLGSQAFTLGGPDLKYRLEKVGYLEELIFRVSGQYDITTATLVPLPRAPRNILRSVRLSPPGRQKILDHGAFSMDIWDQVMLDTARGRGRRDSRLDGLDAQTGRSAVLETFPLGVANDQAFDLWYRQRLTRGALDMRGIIPLHNDQDTTLYVTPNTEANLITVVGNWAQDSLLCEVWQVTRDEVPAVPGVQPFPTGWVQTFEEFEKAPLIVGQNTITIEPDGDNFILGVYVAVALNDLLTTSDDIDGISFEVDSSDVIEPDLDPRVWYFRTKRELGHYLPDGVLYFDFDRDVDTDGALSLIDPAGDYTPSIGRWLSTRGVKQIKVKVRIPVGTTLGASPHAIVGVRRLRPVGA